MSYTNKQVYEPIVKEVKKFIRTGKDLLYGVMSNNKSYLMTPYYIFVFDHLYDLKHNIISNIDGMELSPDMKNVNYRFNKKNGLTSDGVDFEKSYLGVIKALDDNSIELKPTIFSIDWMADDKMSSVRVFTQYKAPHDFTIKIQSDYYDMINNTCNTYYMNELNYNQPIHVVNAYYDAIILPVTTGDFDRLSNAINTYYSTKEAN